MALDVIDPVHDPRIRHCRAQVNGKTYRELLSLQKSPFLEIEIAN